jgi:hypothetical protein
MKDMRSGEAVTSIAGLRDADPEGVEGLLTLVCAPLLSQTTSMASIIRRLSKSSSSSVSSDKSTDATSVSSASSR